MLLALLVVDLYGDDKCNKHHGLRSLNRNVGTADRNGKNPCTSRREAKQTPQGLAGSAPKYSDKLIDAWPAGRPASATLQARRHRQDYRWMEFHLLATVGPSPAVCHRSSSAVNRSSLLHYRRKIYADIRKYLNYIQQLTDSHLSYRMTSKKLSRSIQP